MSHVSERNQSVRAELLPRIKSAKQIAAEAKARQIAEARTRAGRCQHDVFLGFNSRIPCEFPPGHDGPCGVFSR